MTEPSTDKQINLNDLLQIYLDNLLKTKSSSNIEFEIRFGTMKKMKHLTRSDYDNVIHRLVSSGFTLSEPEYHLRINSEFVNVTTGKTRMSNIRAQITGLGDISKYCTTNSIQELYTTHKVKFIQKHPFKASGKSVRHIDNMPFNFRTCFTDEKDYTNSSLVRDIVASWKDTKKAFRYIKRYSLTNPDFPLSIDISIVKESSFSKPVYTFEESQVHNGREKYEIEIEINNSDVGIGTDYNTVDSLSSILKKAIKLVLCGIQESNFPISYTEQNSVLQKYMKILLGDAYKDEVRVYPSNYIGPSSYTLQVRNIAPINKNANIPNVRKDYTVTEKADGTRKLLFITETGKIYFIDRNMKVQFTGAQTTNEKAFQTIIDGEHILHNRKKEFINLYAAFDIYYIQGKDIRKYGFMPNIDTDKKLTFRFPLLKEVINKMKITSFRKDIGISPLTVIYKKFYVTDDTTSIFDACARLFQDMRSRVFDYETDGIIFTPARMGVGADKIGETTKARKVTWEHSFKWKPPEYNTNDFLITIQKGEDGTDNIQNIFQEGTSLGTTSQLTQYKTLILRVGYDESKHGFINPCKTLIDGTYETDKDVDETDKYRPMQFYPTNPTDYNAGTCNIILEEISSGDKVLFTRERQIIEDNTIVEFSYDLTKPVGWRWSPLRVRYDKTALMRSGIKNYGNAYHVANSNWHSIHNPITEDMLITGMNIPDMLADDDVYYNRITNSTITKGLRDFHNLFVKKRLIGAVSSRNDTLIDFAVGKGGDLSKWVKAKLKFILGIDITKDNIENRLDGACARYLFMRKNFKFMPQALFLNGNSSQNIRNSSAFFSDKEKEIAYAIFGVGKKSEELGATVYDNFGIAENGFNISSIQFALHYMFQSKEILNNFLRNVSETTKVGGYFIGTCFDGKKIFSLLKSTKVGESYEFRDEDTKIWSITKLYNRLDFQDEGDSIGYGIDVYQESINKTFREYLVNFDYLDRLIENYGFVRLTKDEANKIGLPDSRGSFKDLYNKLLKELEKNPRKKSEYGLASEMSGIEKTISFLNNYFVYRKVHDVDAKTMVNTLLGVTSLEELSDKVSSKLKAQKSASIIEKTKPSKGTKATGTKATGTKATAAKATAAKATAAKATAKGTSTKATKPTAAAKGTKGTATGTGIKKKLKIVPAIMDSDSGSEIDEEPTPIPPKPKSRRRVPSGAAAGDIEDKRTTEAVKSRRRVPSGAAAGDEMVKREASKKGTKKKLRVTVS